MFSTQFTSGFDGTSYPFRTHQSEEFARAHAAEITGRQPGKCIVLDENGVPVGEYQDGAEVTAAEA